MIFSSQLSIYLLSTCIISNIANKNLYQLMLFRLKKILDNKYIIFFYPKI